MRGTPPHLLDSFNRYLLALFPVFLVLAKIRSRALRLGIWVVSFGMQIFLLLGFLDWRWIA
jgi:5-carboxymethyl-2-hydroxymuconate isomerase